MLKYGLKKQRLNFMSAWMSEEKEMLEKEDECGEDLLSKLFGEDRSDALDELIAKFAVDDAVEADSDDDVIVLS